jgi:hypothetical protein
MLELLVSKNEHTRGRKLIRLVGDVIVPRIKLSTTRLHMPSSPIEENADNTLEIYCDKFNIPKVTCHLPPNEI